MSLLGICFGPKLISFVESKGNSISVSASLPLAALGISELQDKVPLDLKLATAFKEEFRKRSILSKEAVLALSSADMIIRTFEIPLLPQQEIRNALNFEVRKYLPFKLEELVYDFQLQQDKESRRFSVLFLGIKKDTVDRYASIFTQLGIKIKSIEYSAFTLLRLLRLSKISEQGVIAVIILDTEQQEAECTVMKNGFPLFSREIQLLVGAGDRFQIPESNEMSAEKIRTEIRISLDYYGRKFPLQNVREMLFIGGLEFQDSLTSFAKELGLSIHFVNTGKLAAKAAPFSVGMLRAYSSTLVSSVKSVVKVNLMAVWQQGRKRAALKQEGRGQLSVSLFSLRVGLAGFRVEVRTVVIAALLLAGVFGYGAFRKIPLENEIQGMVSSRFSSAAVTNPKASAAELKKTYAEYEQKMKTIEDFVRKQVYVTPFLSVIPSMIPEGMWLDNFSFTNEKTGPVFTLEGYASRDNPSKELTMVHNLLVALKKHPDFSKLFSEINIDTIDSRSVEDKKLSHFIISGKQKLKKGR